MSRLECIPSPAHITDRGGDITITSSNSIVFATGTKPDALILQQLIVDMGGPLLPVTAYRPIAGDIKISYRSRGDVESYTIDADEQIHINAHPNHGIYWAYATLLQIASITKDTITIPRCYIKDKPSGAFRSVMIDLASEWHPIDNLYDITRLCWWYKVKYLHLHFTDNKSWTLPSRSHPTLPTIDKFYTEQQLKDLNQFACSHGVTIIPEVDVPGHSRALIRALPELVANEKSADTQAADGDALIHPGMTGQEVYDAICPGRETTYEFISGVIEELCGIFPDTPYIHIGADEVNKTSWESCVHCQQYMQQHSIPNVEELYRHFIARVNEMVKQHHKQTIVWEGFKADGQVEIPKDVIVMEFENHYELPGALLNAGYQVVNTSWQPLYIVPNASWPSDHILRWNIWRWEHWWDQSQAYPDGLEVQPTEQVIGGGMCSWGITPEKELEVLMPRLPALAERTWNIKGRVNADDWKLQWVNLNAQLAKMLQINLEADQQVVYRPIIPAPQQVEVCDGAVTVTSDNYIVFRQGAKAAADLLQKKIIELGGPHIKVRHYKEAANDILLRPNLRYTPDRYTIDIDEYVDIAGNRRNGHVWAIASLLQMAKITPMSITFPKCRIADDTKTEFRSVMVDLVGHWYPIKVLYDYVRLCWWYKVNYLHLHFTDDGCWTLPSSKYPQLPTPGRHYTSKELRELDEFARQHGVTIIPEVDVPGHSKWLVRELPEIVGNEADSVVSEAEAESLLHPGLALTSPDCTICPGRESTYQFMSDVIDELCQLFPHSPYIHLGGDEVNKVAWLSCKHCKQYMHDHNLPSVEELYRHFIVRMNELVTSHGRQTIVWEGFKVDGAVEIPRDIIVMEYECYYELPLALIDAGYQVINTSWQPNYIVPTKHWPPESILKWNMWRWEHFMKHSKANPFGLMTYRRKNVIGAGMCSWGMEPDYGFTALRTRLPALAERVWNPMHTVDIEAWMKIWRQRNYELRPLLKELP